MKSGRTWTWRAPHGSPDELEAMDVFDILLTEGRGRDAADVEAAPRVGVSAEGRWARPPRRCISRETSLES